MEQFKLSKPENMTSIEMLEKEIGKVLLMEDKGVIKMLVATVIANRMSLDPVWLMLVTSSSGGKTELINSIVSDLKFCHEISDITVNTFMSGQKKTGQETSLLLKMNNGIMIFSDFTSILSKNREARGEILKQLRQIYDGKYIKRTGTGHDPTWNGKVGAIGGCTEIIYRHLEEFSAMGDRFIFYNIDQPDDEAMAKAALRNAPYMQDLRVHLRKCSEFYINNVIEKMDDTITDLNEEQKKRLFKICSFATRARSGVLTDFKTGKIDFIPSYEKPTRMISQINTLASAFIAMRKVTPGNAKSKTVEENKLTDFEIDLLAQTAFDSIPRTRRDAILPLAQYSKGVHTVGLATTLSLPSESARKYLEQLNALGICNRHKESGPHGDLWTINEDYREMIIELEELKVIEGTLQAKGGLHGNDFNEEDLYADEAWREKEKLEKEEDLEQDSLI